MKSLSTQTQQNENVNQVSVAKKETDPEQMFHRPDYLQRFPTFGGAFPANNQQNYRFLHRTIGNQAVGRMIQAKLKIGKPGDKYEHEADRVADQVMRMPAPSINRQPEEEEEIKTKPLAAQITPLVQRQAEEEEELQTQPEEEEALQTKSLLQRQTEEEEEIAQTKLLQCQAEEEEELVQSRSKMVQRICAGCEKEMTEEETLQRDKNANASTVTIQRMCPECKERLQSKGYRGTLQTKAPNGQTNQTSPNIKASINAMKGGGNSLPESTRNFFESRFGADFRNVRVHTDSRVSETAKSINARAFTKGSNIAFGNGQYAPESEGGKKLLAHELTHVVQQSTMGRRVQRFGAKEHMRLGDEATKDQYGGIKTVQLADDYRITFGEMIAMAGDHFVNIDQMRSYAQKDGPGAGTREEIEYVRVVWIHKREEAKNSFSDEAIDAADKRYYKLAGDNRSHFLNPTTGDESRTTADKSLDTLQKVRSEWNGLFYEHFVYDAPLGAGAGYRLNHLRALFEAYFAGQLDEGIDKALAVEAFAGHFLTDAFSSGHVRTARASISEHWDKRVPMFYYNLKGFIAERLAEELEGFWTTEELVVKGASWVPVFGEKGAQEIVSEELEKKGTFTFGDVVSGALHDYDNEVGVKVTIAGQDATLKGDGHLGEGDEQVFATKAVNLSYKEVQESWKLGKEHKVPWVVFKAFTGDGLFSAERLLPKAKADADVPSGMQRIKWDFNDAFSLLSHRKFQKALKIFLKDKRKELKETKDGLESEEQRDAFKKQILDPLETKPIQTVWQVINWTPDTGGGIFGHNQDDNALDYYETSKKMGALGKLTAVQKTNLIMDLMGGLTMGDEEDAIVDLLIAKGSDIGEIISHIGWDELEDEIGSSRLRSILRPYLKYKK